MKYSSYFLPIFIFAVIVLPGGFADASTALTQQVAFDSAKLNEALKNPFVLKQDSRTWKIPASEVKKWYKTSNGKLELRPGAIYDYLNVHVSPKANNLGENSRFTRVGSDVQLIKGGTKGKIVDGIKTSLAIRSALLSGKSTVTVSMKEYRPAIFSAEDFKKLKFPHVLAKGESNFAGSPKNRIHNIHVGTQRFNGLVIMPGEEFSFNRYLGAVDESNGYLPELVIKENVTTPEFGGGICQVSTTAFRAAMIAGLDVTARRNHSYPVAYYGTPGYDATVYSPSPDFRFKNDTANPVLLKTRIEGTKVIFEVLGTNDGRTVKINGPFVTSKKPDGSLTAAVAQIVTKNGKIIREDNFVSNYQSPDKFPTARKANGE